jgi:hypothetical protein
MLIINFKMFGNLVYKISKIWRAAFSPAFFLFELLPMPSILSYYALVINEGTII